MKTKEEVIKSAYGDMWSKLSPSQQKYALKNNGTITFPPSEENGTPQLLSDLWDYFRKNGDKLDDQDYGNNFMSFHTPMSLKGIEDNNGWSRVSDGLPKISGEYLVIIYAKPSRQETLYIDLEQSYGFNFLECHCTHYRLKEKIKKPLY